ncbi:MAG TPA: murein biosynthesis integral membrane protein MurJ [Anaerolineaceae bacterium]|jgi:putative peptidoglycan lipid II flippase|nr:murein biosynthesis integral membrane protein MurJ [Anaerolineaceae bacterium]NMD27759.1 murein biosynthesis integral membrane protein MurJ [Chloroflexota bacterium]HOA20924.1 murein biosynthesis integral membrane protein MurJ [Anaerolineaceae bacterium]HOG76695.1 murein biosynthesis integral membrane protein MurJ [Anaerolineaceae bacterium]
MKKLSRLTKVSLLLAVLFSLDKLLGVARQMLVSRQFGLSAELDVFNAANNLPDMLFMLISGGALAIAFIPVLTEVLSKEGQEKAWSLFSNILNIAFLVTAALAILIAIFAGPLVSGNLGIAPGFSSPQIALTIKLLRLNLIATLVFSLSGLVMAGLQANQHFLLPALAPIFYDFGQILGVVMLAPSKPYQIGPLTLPALGLGIEGMVYGVIIGALLHLLIQVPGLIKFHFRWQPRANLSDPETQKVLRLMGPRLLSMLFIQLIFLAQDNFASRLATGSVTALTYGWWIMQVPETLIGTAIATAVLPTLAELFSQSAFEDLKAKIEKVAQVMLALTIPIAVVAGIVIQPLIQVLLGLEPADTARVVLVTRVFLLGISGHSLVELFVRSFYAMQKPKYPLLLAGLTLLFYLAAGWLLSARFEAAGIAAANTLAYTLQAAVLLILLAKVLTAKPNLRLTLVRAVLGAALGGAAAWSVMRYAPIPGGGLVSAAVGGILGLLLAALALQKDLRALANL